MRKPVEKTTRVDPPKTCTLCPRLVAFRSENRKRFPDFHNAPARMWGRTDAPLLIVGLAPGLKGANRTGTPFTGDDSGALLFEVLVHCRLAREEGDDVALRGCAITNAVACVPPGNKPNGSELANCRPWLLKKLDAGPKVVLALGRVAHDSVLKTQALRISEYPFAHGSDHALPGLRLISSYHPSRYNVFTKRIDFERLNAVVSICADAIGCS